MRIEKDNLIEFVNVVNECCCVMEHDKVADWLLTPNSNLNMAVSYTHLTLPTKRIV